MEKEYISKYKNYVTKYLPSYKTLGSYWVSNFDIGYYNSTNDLFDSLVIYLNQLSLYSKHLTQAAYLRQTHYERFITTEDKGHQAWREGQNMIAKDAEYKLQYWTEVKEDYFDKIIEYYNDHKPPETIPKILTENVDYEENSNNYEKVRPPVITKREKNRRKRLKKNEKKKLKNLMKNLSQRRNIYEKTIEDIKAKLSNIDIHIHNISSINKDCINILKYGYLFPRSIYFHGTEIEIKEFCKGIHEKIVNKSYDSDVLDIINNDINLTRMILFFVLSKDITDTFEYMFDLFYSGIYGNKNYNTDINILEKEYNVDSVKIKKVKFYGNGKNMNFYNCAWYLANSVRTSHILERESQLRSKMPPVDRIYSILNYTKIKCEIYMHGSVLTDTQNSDSLILQARENFTKQYKMYETVFNIKYGQEDGRNEILDFENNVSTRNKMMSSCLLHFISENS